ncbi:hypothetical protein EYF80_063346 [Liparis tanakae]|uniref:Uncharacterized protein n=1 Tax=Liparis tanakae TaxID=230148 RepID=A0A4Z2ECD5_9TELE|nr:hypothetical protein EYF80_063346 [Liparis tanakae]
MSECVCVCVRVCVCVLQVVVCDRYSSLTTVWFHRRSSSSPQKPRRLESDPLRATPRSPGASGSRGHEVTEVTGEAAAFNSRLSETHAVCNQPIRAQTEPQDWRTAEERGLRSELRLQGEELEFRMML